jgi:hypothetical protein
MKIDSPPNRRRAIAPKKPPLSWVRIVRSAAMLAMASDSATMDSPGASVT